MRTARALVILIPALHSALAQTRGAISGSVFDERGRPKPGVWVTAIRTTLPPARATAASDKNGAFLLPDLTAGDYRLCTQVPDGGYVDVCRWEIFPAPVKPALTLRQGQGLTNVRIDLKPASAVTVRINDPQALLTAAHPERAVMVGVFNSAGIFYAVPLKSVDAGGRLHQIWIPFETPVRLSLSGRRVSLADERGLAVPATGVASSMARPANGPVPAAFVYTVTGVAAH